MAGPGDPSSAFNLAGQLPEPPQPPQQDYLPTQGRRGWQDWNEPDFHLAGARMYPGTAPGPWMPQAGDVDSIIRNAGGMLGKNGSVPVQALAGNMMMFRGNFIKGYLQGQEARTKLEHEQYVNAQHQLYDRQRRELERAQDLFRTFSDPKDADQLRQRMLLLAKEMNDPNLQTKLESGASMHDIQGMLNDRANWNMDFLKIIEQRGKAEQERLKADKERDELQNDPWVTGPTRPPTADRAEIFTSQATSGAPGGVSAPAGSLTPSPAPSDPGALGGVSGAAGGGAGAGATPPPTSALARASGLSAQGETLAREIARGGTPNLQGIPSRDLNRIQNFAAHINSELDDLARSGKSGPELLNDIRNADPTTASLVDDLAGYRAPLPQNASAANQRLETLVGKVKPGWNRGMYEWAQQFRNPNQNTQRILLRANGAAEAAAQVLTAVNALDPKQVPVQNYIDQWEKRHFTNDPKWTAVFTSLQNYLNETAGIMSGTGRPYVSTVRELLSGVPATAGAANIRTAVKIHAANSYALVERENELWQINVNDGHNAPGFSPTADAIFSAIRRMDPHDGKITGAVPERLREIARGAADPKADAARKWLEAHPNDPRAADIRKALGM